MEMIPLGMLLAVLAAIFWGGGNMFARLGLQSIKAASGAILSLTTSLVVALIIALTVEFDDLVSVSLVAIGWFALIGLLHFAVGRVFLYQGMRYIGAARATSVGGSNPLFALIIAFMFLGEIPTMLGIIGTVTIVCGLFFLLRESSETRLIITRKDRVLGYSFSLGTALCWGAVAVIIRYASQFASPFVVLTFSLLFAILVLLGVTGKGFEIGVKTNKKAINLLLFAGVLNGIALACFYWALAVAPVVVVSPLTSSSPLVTVILVHFFLRRLERLTLHVLIGSLLVVTGGVLVAIY